VAAWADERASAPAHQATPNIHPRSGHGGCRLIIAPARNGLTQVGRMLPQPQIEDRDRRRMLLDNRLGSQFCLLLVGRHRD
jgi:hypothetical protein